jgi:sulfur transfer complex TusBCD TusB component (DsrH family)
MANFHNLTLKLQKGLAKKGVIVFVNKNQFWSEKQQKPVNVFVVYETEYDDIRRRRVQHEVMRSVSMADIVMYLGTRYKGLSVSDAVDKVKNNSIDTTKMMFIATDGEAQKRMEEEILRRNNVDVRKR